MDIHDPHPDCGVPDDYDDVGEAIREDRALRTARAYRMLYANNGLDFGPLLLNDPVPLGRQILETAGVRALAAWSLLAILPSGDFEDVRLDEPFDLRDLRVERLIGFETDRLFKFALRDNQILWGRPTIAGHELYALAEAGEHEAVFLDVPGGTDRLILGTDTVDLAEAGVERFIVAPKPISDAFEITVIYNGLARAMQVRPGETVAAVIAVARPLFGSPGGDLILVDQQGRELNPAHTLHQEQVGPHAQLSLRPPVVRGG
jgi:hypothetical protein